MAGADPLLSILMVNWNTRDMTLACLRSIYVQTERTPFEIILVDNGSTDGSANAIAHDFPAVRLLAEDKNHGFAHANNLAAAQARGEYLLLLNTDTLVLDQAIDRLVDFAQLLPRAGIWGGRTWFANGRLNPSSVWGGLRRGVPSRRLWVCVRSFAAVPFSTRKAMAAGRAIAFAQLILSRAVSC